MGNGRNPGVAELQALGKKHRLKNAASILAKVRQAVSNWPHYAEQAGVSSKSTKAFAVKLQL
jgi:hypothetical protein